MRVVYFIDHLRPDGAQHVLAQLVRGLAERGHNQAVVCLNNSWDAEIRDLLCTAGCEVRIVGKTALAMGTGWIPLLKWLRQEKFDAAVTLLFVSDVVGRTLAHQAGIPRVASYLQARNTNYAGWQRSLVRSTMKYADQVVLCSQSIQEFAVQNEGVDPRKVSIIPHGIAVDHRSSLQSRIRIRAEFQLLPEDRLLGSLGRLTYQKGYDILLAALAQVADPAVHLLIAGTGELHDELRLQAGKLGIRDRVHFAGYRRDVPEILDALDIYVQPSRFEGMPLAVLEAMAAGLPIIASAVDGNCELIQNGVSGWLAPPEASRAFAAAIESALADPMEAKKRGRCARKIAHDQFSQEAMVNAWEALLMRGGAA